MQTLKIQRMSLIAFSGFVIVGFLLGLMQFAVITARATTGTSNSELASSSLYQMTPPPFETATPTPNPHLRQKCAPLIQNGNFEDTGLMPLWEYTAITEQVTRTTVPHWQSPGESYSMLLPATNVGGVPRQPWLYQEFVLPTWVLTPALETGSELTLSLHVGVNPEGSPQPDPLYVVLLDQSGLMTITEPITVATGADTPTINPLAPDNNDWILKTIDLVQYFNPVDYKNQTLRLHFYSPNPTGTYSTRFYLDNVDLTLCTTQNDADLSLAIAPPRSTTVPAGEALTLTHVLTYAGSGVIPDVITLSAGSAPWPPTWSPLTTTLAPGQSAPVTVSLNAPGDAIDFTLNVLTLTVTGPGGLSDQVVDTVTIAPPQLFENEITPSGVSQPVITLTAGASVIWRNQTLETQGLAPTCTDLPPDAVTLYLPVVLKSTANVAMLANLPPLSTQSISATIAAGQAYTQTFTAAGSFDYCVSSAPTQTNTVVVLPTPPADFRLAASPISQVVSPTQGAPYDVHLNALYGFSEPVTVSLSGLTGSAQIEPPVVVPPTGKTHLFITPSLTTPNGAYPLTVLAQANTVSHTAPVSLVVIGPTPPPVGPDIRFLEGPHVYVGQLVTILVQMHSPGPYDICFAGQWITTLNIASDGNGVRPYTIPSLPARPDYRLESFPAGGGTCSGIPVAVSIITVTQTGPDFNISITPHTSTIVLEQETSLLVELTALNPFTSPVTLTVTQAPTETLTQFVANPITPSANTVLTLTTSVTAPLGLHPLTIQATSGQLTHTATAVLSITQPKLDVAVVLDRSGSMEFDPISYGNWERTAVITDHVNDIPRWSGYYNYPANGVIYPVGYSDGDATDGGFGHPLISGSGGVCDTAPASSNDFTYTDGGNHYVIMEAELYSHNNTTPDPILRETGKGYWAMQRGEGNYGEIPPYYPSTGASIDARPAHMAHHPSLTSYETAAYGFHYALAHAQANDAPVLEYDFKFRDGPAVTWSGSAYIWVRVHAGRGLDVDNNEFGDTAGPRNDAYWTVVSEPDDGALVMDAIGFNPNTIKPVQNIPSIPVNNGTGWEWVRLQDPVTVNTNNINRLYIYAGATGFSIDRIMVTDNATTSVSNLPIGVRDGTVTATTGSAFRVACSPCNVIYGEDIGVDGSGTPYELDDCGPYLPYAQPIDQRLDPIFADFENPMRSAKEAVKLFVTRLDPVKDQVGLVSYSTNSNVGTGGDDIYKTELECLRRVGVQACDAPTISYTQVLRDIEDISASTATNTGAGMKAGLEVLGIDLYDVQPLGPNDCNGGHCARDDDEARKVMVVLTDGIPNQNPGGACIDANPAYGLPIGAAGDDANHRCPMYFAQQAANRGVTVYVIGLGYGVNGDYLKAVAQLGAGQYYFSAGADLDLIFAEIRRGGVPYGPNHCEVLPLAIQEDALAGLNEGDFLSDIRQGGGSGNFLFIRWRDVPSAVPWITVNTGSLAYLTLAVEYPWLSQVDYLNPTDTTDYTLEVGNTVWVFTGQVGGSLLMDALTARSGQLVRLPVFDTVSGTGQNQRAHISGFIRFRLTGVNFQANPNTLSGLFMGWDNDCGG